MTPAGYSGTPLPKKLGVTETSRVALIDAPPGFARELPVAPARAFKDLDVVLMFVTHRADLSAQWATATAGVTLSGCVWVCWPKKAAVKALGLDADMTEDAVREVVLPTGWVDIKVCAVDETWSGLKCVLRVEHRPQR